MGGKPENVGSLGDIEKVAKVFVRNELIPLQDRIREINGWLGQEVIRFKTTHWTLTTAEHRRLRAAFYTPSSRPHAHHRTKHPQTHQRLNGQTKRHHDALRR